jgi:putative DNA primase/helicase
MKEAGKRARAGQEVRLLDVPADAKAGHGIFEDLHGHASGAALADALNDAVSRNHGVAAREFIAKIAQIDKRELRTSITELRRDFRAEVLPKGDEDGQVVRACDRFSLIAAAGELATKFGITGWEPGEAFRAAAACFRAWVEHRGGTGPQEEARALEQVRHFIQSYGESRFTDVDELRSASARSTAIRAGFRKTVNGITEYWFLPAVFKQDVCAGLDYRFVLDVLKRRGMLQLSEAGHRTCKKDKVGRVYVVREVADEG